MWDSNSTWVRIIKKIVQPGTGRPHIDKRVYFEMGQMGQVMWMSLEPKICKTIIEN